MGNETFNYRSSFFRVWKERFTGKSPIVLGVSSGRNGTVNFEKLLFDDKTLLYKKSIITFTSDEIPLLMEKLKELGH